MTATKMLTAIAATKIKNIQILFFIVIKANIRSYRR